MAGAGAHAHWARAAAAGAAGSETCLLGVAWRCSCRSCRSLRSRCRRAFGCRRLRLSFDFSTDGLTDALTDAMPRSHRPPPTAQRPANATGNATGNAAEPKPEGGSLATTFKIFLLFAGLMVKVPVGLYFSCKLLLFQSLLLMSPDDSGFYATIVAVVGLHVVLAVFVFIVWKEGMPDWQENKNE